uniref:AIG1-type G domain-containing protein n=1 Tax=Meleagris gallopavo TaxID=9103 RepID=A0A803Y9G7_MELGA
RDHLYHQHWHRDAAWGRQPLEELLSVPSNPCPVVPAGERQELRVVLLGRSGAGRSATGNTLLGEERFESHLASQPVTTTCSDGRRHWRRWCVVVVDTPAIFGGSQWDKHNEACREITHCIELSSPGPHVLLLVTQLGRFTQEDQEAVRGVQDIFGVGVFRHMVVVFTRGEELVGGSLHNYVTHTDNRALRNLIQSCWNRYCSINNRASGAERDQQVQQLMNKVRETVRENEGRYYSNELYLDPFLTEEKVRYHMEKAARPWGVLLDSLSYRRVLTKSQGCDCCPGELLHVHRLLGTAFPLPPPNPPLTAPCCFLGPCCCHREQSSAQPLCSM